MLPLLLTNLDPAHPTNTTYCFSAGAFVDNDFKFTTPVPIEQLMIFTSKSTNIEVGVSWSRCHIPAEQSIIAQFHV